MAKIMAINSGSSSIKFQLLEMPEEKLIASGVMERIGLEEGIFTLKYNGKKEVTNPVLADHSVGVKLLLKTLIEKKILADLNEISGVGHRVVQGGEFFKDSAIVTDEVVDKIRDLADLAPLHNLAHIVGINAFREALPEVPNVVVFDTVFHQTMPEEAYMYATPYEWYEKYGIRKYGAHGTSHQFVSKRAIELLGSPKESKIIVCHLGNGASLCAVKDGKCLDTSMGLTPLEGIPMGTRSGNIDPTVVSYICQKENLTPDEVVNVWLNKKSGYLGVSGKSNDARDVTAGMNSGDHRCKLTFDIQAKRICDYIGSYYVYLGGLDAICFTAGMGENLYHLREKIVSRLGVLGVKLDTEANKVMGEEQLISTPDSKVKVYVIPTNEEVMIARDVLRIAKIA